MLFYPTPRHIALIFAFARCIRLTFHPSDFFRVLVKECVYMPRCLIGVDASGKEKVSCYQLEMTK